MQIRHVVTGCTAAAIAIGTVFVAGAAAGQGRGRGAAAPQVHANMAQLMRGMLYPASNVIFSAQSDDPAAIKPAPEPSTSPNPLTSTYGGWQAVENAGLVLAESANLLTIPRMCANGKPAPVQSPEWTKALMELREAGLASYKAAQAKNQDQIVDAADKVATACASCHDVYREKSNPADRCTK